MRYIILLSMIFLFGCSPSPQSGMTHNIVCIDGVEYISAMYPHFKPDGTLYTC